MPVASVTVTPASGTVSAGSSLQLTATPKDGNGNPLVGRTVTWQSSNTAAATVNGSGLVSGVAAGSATITATSEGQSGTSAITVTPPGTQQFGHVFIVTEENTDYVDVTSSSMPYLTGLAAQYGLATQYYANTHPSIGNDAHDCSLSTADSWLQTNIAPLLASPVFQQDGLLIVVFDESGGDNTLGGGKVYWAAISPKAKRGYQSTTTYQHQSTVRLILKGLGINTFPGDAATAPDMSEFFNP